MQTPRLKLVLFAGECLTASVVFASDFLHPATFLHSNKPQRWNFLRIFFVQCYWIHAVIYCLHVLASLRCLRHSGGWARAAKILTNQGAVATAPKHLTGAAAGCINIKLANCARRKKIILKGLFLLRAVLTNDQSGALSTYYECTLRVVNISFSGKDAVISRSGKDNNRPTLEEYLSQLIPCLPRVSMCRFTSRCDHNP